MAVHTYETAKGDRIGQDRYEKHPNFCTVPSLNAYVFDFANDC